MAETASSFWILRRRSPAESLAWRQSFGCFAIAQAAGPRSADEARDADQRHDDLAGLRKYAGARSESFAGAAARVAGVDGWAWRKGHKHCAIIVDLERSNGHTEGQTAADHV
jgi:hypothetical protein